MYLSSAFEPCVKDCQQPQQIDQEMFFLFASFPGWAGASQGMSTFDVSESCGSGRGHFSALDRSSNRAKEKDMLRRPNLPRLRKIQRFLYRLSRRGKHVPLKKLFLSGFGSNSLHRKWIKSCSMKESCHLPYPNSLCFKVGEPLNLPSTISS